eukprot:CAMPEP_0183718422 /NCGR_PEP_ID=MMETSP0737-20130205/11683_1 /TAXON_ID=385413 /ORGANISM="Thalassiosira miniscula, Strain CCMP1093" /LENGTH=937 /DNA_ID=CAMNT_0025947977 /DNA_START=95 /DNA_END=2908 /DNA_ORIENTATION=+
MKFAYVPFFASTLAMPIAADGASTRLRGNARVDASDQEAHPKRTPPKDQDCIIQVAALLEIEPGTIDDVKIDCQGSDGMFQPVKGSPSQMAKIKKMFADGELNPGKSRMDLSKNVGFGRNKEIVLGAGFDPKASIRKGPPEGKGVNNGSRSHPIFDRGLQTNPTDYGNGGVEGDKPILVVKVTDASNRARPESATVISDDIFGTNGDPVNLKSQLEGCSMGKLNIIPGDNGSELVDQSVYAAPGTIEVTLDIDLTDSSYSNNDVMNAVTAKVENKLDLTLPGPYDQVIYVLEQCYYSCGWAAYAYYNSWISVYISDYYKHVGVLVHELGHNFNLAHSGGLNGAAYSDHTGMMGNPLFYDDIGKMCYNAAKNWQIGWYDDRKQTVSPLSGGGDWSQAVTMVGIADYLNNPDGRPVVIKLETGTSNDYFVGFNRAIGVNADNDEADDMVTIVQTGANGEYRSQSFLKAKLGPSSSMGEIYTIENFGGVAGKDVVVEVTNIDLTTDPATADILFRNDQPPTAAPTTLESCLSQPGKTTMSVDILTDNYPSETTWSLVNECTGSEDATGGGYTSPGTSYSTGDMCVDANSQYTFTINDTFGDGICCSYGSGSYTITYDGAQVASGGEFGSTESKIFGSCGPTPTPPPTTPNPTKVPTHPPSNSPSKSPTSEPTNNPVVGPTPAPWNATPSPSPTDATPSPSPTPPPNTSGTITASYDASLRAPKCSAVGSSCTSGASLLIGTQSDSTEPNGPNSLDTCTDGPYGRYQSDESIDQITVSSVDGGQLQYGKRVEIEARVFPWNSGSYDTADFYIAPDASSRNPVWSYIGSASPTSAGFQTLKMQYDLPAGEIQAVRVNFRFLGDVDLQTACNGGNWDDVDDLVFSVLPGAAGVATDGDDIKPAPIPPPAVISCEDIGDMYRCAAALPVCKWQGGENSGCHDAQ